MMVSEQTRLARVGKATDGIAEAATRVRLAKTSSATTRVEITRVEITRVEIGKRKAAAAAVAGGVVGIARTGVTAVVAAILNATTSR
jgi:hypothetical protein